MSISITLRPQISRGVSTITRAQYLQLEGLFTLARRQSVALDELDQAACAITGDEPGRPGAAYDLGRDCALHGPNQTNCHFSIFSSPENTAEWERGKRDGEQFAP